ncbi:MAG: hypothetical protein HYW10_02965, partial [Candidatus Omnitrophica bacterium]|nr:hypothetical protein [Candidatus Omnitrophota bacterium]
MSTFSPKPLYLQANGGNIAINGAFTPRRPLDVVGEIVSTGSGGGRFTMASDLTDTSPTWHIDNWEDRFRIFRQPTINAGGTEFMTVRNTGNVGIGTATPDPYRLYVNGNQFISGTLTFSDGWTIPSDVAENMDCPGCEAADVVVIDPDHDQRLTRSTRPYDYTVAGVISEKPTLHIGGSRAETAKPLALAGQVTCKVTAENGPIKRGDL